MSLGEVQQIYAVLLKIDEILTRIENKTENLERDLPKTKEALMTLRDLERVTLRYVALARRISGSERADDLIRILTRIMVTMQMLYISGTMLFSATPYGVLMGIAGVAMAQASMLEGY